jgi:hypothetical protein
LLPGQYTVNSYFENKNYLWTRTNGLLYPTEYSFDVANIANNEETDIPFTKEDDKIIFTFTWGFYGLYIPGATSLLYNDKNVEVNKIKYELAGSEGGHTLTVTPLESQTLTSVDFSVYKQCGTGSNIKEEVLKKCHKISIKYNNKDYDYIVAAKTVIGFDGEQTYLLIDSKSSFGTTGDMKFNPASINTSNTFAIEVFQFFCIK